MDGSPEGRGYHTKVLPPSLSDDERVAAIRELLPATSAGIYLNTGSVGPLPAETAAAMDEIATQELRTGRGHPDYWLETLERFAEARASLAAVLATDIDAIALTHSTTDGINTAVLALPWQAGDRVLTTNQEHAGVLGPLLSLRDRVGVEVVLVDVGEGRDDEATVRAFEKALERPARALVFSHVLWTTGALLPVERIAALGRERRAVTILDAAQSVGAMPVHPDDIGVDALALPAQKWLLGPEGMGGLWLSQAARRSTPALGGYLTYETIDRTGAGRRHPSGRRFESTTFHRPSVVGFARSLGWLAMSVGLPWAFERGVRQARSAAERLRAIPGVTVITPRDRMATLVSFQVARWPGEQAYEELSSRTFAIMRHVPDVDALRISVGFWNTDAELDRLAEGVALLAAHAPHTLEPRRRLTVLGADGRSLG